ncbi:MAG: hypothetical protein HFJ60_08835 [Clostridia bacterium]|nr:hypothetical protein [Clostridia bacterium]
MINHVEQFKRVKETFEDFEKEYKTFKKKISYENRSNLKLKINQHRESLSNLVSSINNIFLR